MKHASASCYVSSTSSLGNLIHHDLGAKACVYSLAPCSNLKVLFAPTNFLSDIVEMNEGK